MSRKFVFKDHFPCDDFKGYLHIDQIVPLMPDVFDLPYVDCSFIVGHYVGSSFRLDFISSHLYECYDFISEHSSFNYCIFHVELKHKRLL